MKHSISRVAASSFRLIRDLWLMTGVVLVLVLALDACYRSQAFLRTTVAAWRTPPDPQAPYADSAWFDAFMAEQNAASRLQWEPYLYWRRLPFRGQFVNVDEDGRRLTVQTTDEHGARKPVFFFGGSTMQGLFQRDAMTIPSCVAAHNFDNPSAPRLEVTNFGETGYVFTQEVLQLLLELRRGGRPDIVVFYDGINDVMATIQNAKAGIPQNEINRESEFNLGRTVYNWRADAASDIRAWAALTAIGAGRLQLPQRLVGLLKERALPPGPPIPALAQELVSSYLSTAGIVEGLAAAYGFRVLYIWQPTLPGSTKVFTPFETGLLEGMKGVAFQESRTELHRLLPPMLDSAMKPLVGARFLNLSEVFVGDPSPVYVDEIGHTTESAVPVIVRSFWEPLAELLGEAPTPFSPRPGFCGAR